MAEECSDAVIEKDEPSPEKEERVPYDFSYGDHYLLKFHAQMVRDISGWDESREDLEDSGLLIAANGLAIARILVFTIEVYSRNPGLVFLLNTSAQELEFLKRWIRDVSISKDLNANLNRIISIGANVPRADRVKIYEKGGVISITSRILIVDMLTDTVQNRKIVGIVVNHSERVIDSSVEKFILRLFRDKNKEGFIRAFSDEPGPFSAGLLQLERAMKGFQIRKVFLWPRFRIEAGQELNKGVVDLVEVRVPVTKLVCRIQEGLVECLEQSLSELRRSVLGEDPQEVTLENVLLPDLSSYLNMYIGPFWHRMTPKAKKIISDMRLIRRLIMYLLSLDSVSFYMFLKTVFAADLRERLEESESNPAFTTYSWLMLEAAQSVLTLARERLYKKVNNDIISVLEEQPKWKVLRKIMGLIRKDREKKIAHNKCPGAVLITVDNPRTCQQISSILCDTDSPPAFLSSLLNDHFAWDSTLDNFPRPAQQPASEEPKFKRRRTRINQNKPHEQSEDKPQSHTSFTFIKPCPDTGSNIEEVTHISNIGFSQNDSYIHIWPYTCGSSENSAAGLDGDEDAKILDELRPQYIIMYDQNLGFIRRIEIFRSLTSKDIPLSVYSLVYDGSVEEQMYLSQIRKERAAFEKLINDAGNMTIPVGPQPSKRAPRHSETFLWDALDSRDIGTQLDAVDIIVDIREFRSPLPFALYEQGARLLPCTLEVGDYILSPQIAVERKSIGDLLQSLSSGRLYSQASAMCIHYDIPVLLIEWAKDHPFSFKYDHHTKGEITSKEIYNKLILLCLTFPKLRLLWSSSPDASAEMLLDLKKNQEEPNMTAAMETGVDGPQKISTSFAITPVEILRGLPSITARNYRYVISKVVSLTSLVKKGREWFEEILGKSPGATLWSFINFDVRSQTTPGLE